VAREFFIMKPKHFLLLAALNISVGAQTAVVSQPVATIQPDMQLQVVALAQNHRAWQRVSSQTNGASVFSVNTNAYIELRTGMAHVVNGQWTESSDQIEITTEGAKVTNATHQVYFTGNLNSTGAVHLVTPAGQHLVSHIMGVSFWDEQSGKTVLIAEPKDSTGQLLPGGNLAIYADALTDFTADVVYRSSILGLEQDLVIRSQIPSPAEWGLDPASSWFQLLTEFENSPEPTVSSVIRDGDDDEFLDFGSMQMGKGEAFAIGSETNKIPVIKRWSHLDGRVFLIEQVKFQNLLPQLQGLPASASDSAMLKGSPDSVLHKVASRRLLPSRKVAQTTPRPMEMAQAALESKGVVLDYTILSSQANLVLQADTTYYVNGTVNVSGTTTIEGNTVVKFDKSTTASLVTGNVVCKTDPFRPAVFSAKDDNDVGQVISGSSANPNGYYGSIALNLSAGSGLSLTNFRFCYLSNALAGSGITLQDGQFIKCKTAFANGPAQPTLYNILLYQINSLVSPTTSSGDNVTLENVTAHFCTNFMGDLSGTIRLTNCLFVCVTNWQCTTTLASSNAILTSDVGVFRSVGGGSHYLADNSPYRWAGTTNIYAGLIADLALKTTYPPIVYSNATLSTDTTLGPQAVRDRHVPDLGYHYDPLDYVFGGSIANANVTFQPGTAVGWFRTVSGWQNAGYGLHLADTKVATFAGTMEAPDYWVRCNVAQEGCNGIWQGGYGPGGIDGSAWPDIANSAQIVASFTKFSMLAGDTSHYRDDWGWLVANAINCEFYGSSVGYYNGGEHYTNCLFERCSIGLSTDHAPSSFFMRNCTVNGTLVSPSRSGDGTNAPCVIRECAFDGTTISTSGAGAGVTYYDYNAFLTASNRTIPAGAHDQLVSSFNWQPSTLGRFYLPTTSSLINTGGVTADLISLYHFTTAANQVKETNSVVDIGYHYLALSGGVSVDSDSDGIPDYLEDKNGNGNGADDTTSWQAYNSSNGLSAGNGLQVFTPLK